MQLRFASRRRTAISLTPLIDVVFILLLFFMLTTQFSRQQAMVLTLPKAKSGSVVDSVLDSLSILQVADGSVEFEGESGVLLSSLKNHELIQSALLDGRPVIVRAKDEVDLQTFTQLMDSLAALGFTDVSVRGLQ